MPLTGPAAARLYDDHVDAVHAMVTRRVGKALGAKVTSEVFEQAVRTWDRFDPESGTERLFLLGTATVILRGHADAERQHLLRLRPVDRTGGIARDPLITVRGPDGERIDTAEVDVDDLPDDEIALTMRAVTELAPDDRDILLLSLWEGCQHAAVAEALDLAVGTVRSSLGRIRRDLKKAVTASKQSTLGASDATVGSDSKDGAS
ncbi:putative RNA polymerase ECF subfamily sigma factor [Ilumatobacter coccineus YM16-304]|uniref:Putative RNA polymerase ECF subfamily sigma factor n=1 Tax=Ilumatobacter coccineus (strain NBRC 103263 / KCTC 29153 / YM16-304) TaxID=1313172 RepID=A0A6C7EBJ8_ILUCY|nr:putative RNA polymerase ECF subfamily sigma factor [Ilumatobacter coccineus YM16-304]